MIIIIILLALGFLALAWFFVKGWLLLIVDFLTEVLTLLWGFLKVVFLGGYIAISPRRSNLSPVPEKAYYIAIFEKVEAGIVPGVISLLIFGVLHAKAFQYNTK